MAQPFERLRIAGVGRKPERPACRLLEMVYANIIAGVRALCLRAPVGVTNARSARFSRARA